MRVLYVCTGNCFRSPLAEALTRRYKPEFEVESAGVRPTGSIAGSIYPLLDKVDALQFVKPSPDKVSERAVNEADLVVVMEKSHEDYLVDVLGAEREKIECWSIDDPIEPDVKLTEAFEEIKKRVRLL